MDTIRWLATNKVVLTVWGLGILAILLAFIFGGGKKADQETAAVETKVVEAVAEKKAEPAKLAAVATASVATAVVASTVQAAVNIGDAKVESVETKVASTETQAAAAAETAETTEAATGSDSSAVQAVADGSPSSLVDKSNDDLLMMAREAYWDNGLDEAASLYSELITREPSVIEHKGELGNVFWRQGYPKKAAELYANIAEPMIAQGNGERVSNMVGFIGLFFPERAGNIRNLLDAQ